MRRQLAALAALTTLLVLVGCGSDTAHPAINGHTCHPADQAMQCVLRHQPPPPRQITPPTAILLHGVDFAWGGPRSCAAMRSLGARFVIGYLSYDQGKNLGVATTQEARRCGVATVVGWETTANRAAQGFAAGASDAREAGRQAAALGNVHDAIWFAIDFDANGPEVYSYFKGAQSVLGSRVNAYGGYRPLAYLHAHGAVGNLNFQTYAWSGGAWLPASIAPLEQYLNGNAFDNDRAIAANYGQFPAPTAPGPSQATVRRWRHQREAAFHVYHSHGCRSPQTGNSTPASFGVPNVCRDQAAAVVGSQTRLWTVYKRWACFGPQARTRSEICWIVRPEASYASHARNATRRALRAHGCRQPYRRRVCRALGQRDRYFTSKVSSITKQYS